MRVNHSFLELGSEEKKNEGYYTITHYLGLFQEVETERDQSVTKQEFVSFRKILLTQHIRPQKAQYRYSFIFLNIKNDVIWIICICHFFPPDSNSREPAVQ